MFVTWSTGAQLVLSVFSEFSVMLFGTQGSSVAVHLIVSVRPCFDSSRLLS